MTGVQTCALPIFLDDVAAALQRLCFGGGDVLPGVIEAVVAAVGVFAEQGGGGGQGVLQIGRASCRERVSSPV